MDRCGWMDQCGWKEAERKREDRNGARHLGKECGWVRTRGRARGVGWHGWHPPVPWKCLHPPDRKSIRTSAVTAGSNSGPAPGKSTKVKSINSSSIQTSIHESIPPPEETEGGGRNKTGSDFRTWKAESATTTWLELTSSSCRHRFSANDSTTGSTSFKLDNPNPNSNVINQSIN